MKQNFLRVLVPFFALCLLAGCGTEKPGTTPESAPADWPLRISAILPHDDQGYWTTLGAGILERAGELEADAKIVTPQLNYNISQMIELIRQATAAQVDAIIVQGIEDPDYLRALEDASDAGVQVVMVDTNVAETFPHLYVGTDNYAAGVQLGRELIRETDGKAVVAVLTGAEGYPNLDARLRGLQDVIKEQPGIEIRRVEYDEYDSLTVMEKYNLILREDPDVDTIVCVEGTGGQTFGRLLTPDTCPLKHLLGFDLSDETLMGLSSGLIDGSLVQQQKEMGRMAVEELVRYFDEGAYRSMTLYTPTVYVTAQDLNEEGVYEG